MFPTPFTSGNQLLDFNLTTWGWIHLLVGLGVALAGVAVWLGRVWARVVAVILVLASAMTSFLFIPHLPVLVADHHRPGRPRHLGADRPRTRRRRLKGIARRVQQRGDDSVVKLRPVVPSALPDSLRRSKNLVVEVDAMPGGYRRRAPSGRLTSSRWPRAGRTIRKLFSNEQRAFLSAHAPDGIELDDLSMLGPNNLLKLKFSPEGFGCRLVADLWMYPDGSRILELSTKCAPAAGFDVAAESRAFLPSRDIDLYGEQQTNTALEFFPGTGTIEERGVIVTTQAPLDGVKRPGSWWSAVRSPEAGGQLGWPLPQGPERSETGLRCSPVFENPMGAILTGSIPVDAVGGIGRSPHDDIVADGPERHPGPSVWSVDRVRQFGDGTEDQSMPIDPALLAKSIVTLTDLDPERDLARTLEQAVLAAKQLFIVDAAGVMPADNDGNLRWASASDQRAQILEGSQESFAAGPCTQAFAAGRPAIMRPWNRGGGKSRSPLSSCRSGLRLASRWSLVAARSAPWMCTRLPRGAGTKPRSARCRPMPGWWRPCSGWPPGPRSRVDWPSRPGRR
jgi:hypothetical protein